MNGRLWRVLVAASVALGAATIVYTPAAAAEPAHVDPGVVPDRYIVMLRDTGANEAGVGATAAALVRRHGGAVRQVFATSFRGFSARLTKAQAEALAAEGEVAAVEPVRRYKASSTQTNPPSWGLDRIDQTTPVLSKSFTSPGTAGNVTAYVIDTGIKTEHVEFEGRASIGLNGVADDPDGDRSTDCFGHGTHVAGTIGGKTFGVAKAAKLVSVRVLDCYGYGTTEEVVAGIDWVTANAVKPAVANLSLEEAYGTVIHLPVEAALRASIASGVTYTVAAGNTDGGCDRSPGSVSEAITVGATTHLDFRAWFSPYGSCVDIFAPGTGIKSAYTGPGTAANHTATLNGTSMAAAHAAGAAALLLSTNPTWSPARVQEAIVTGGISGAIKDTQEGTNRLLHIGPIGAARAKFAFKAYANGNYVSAESAGTKPLIASRPAVGLWEQFDQVDAGGGYIALKSRANGKYVTALNAGRSPLIALRTAVLAHEKFLVVNNPDGSISLKANANGLYVSAESAGSKPLIASRGAIGQWEKFEYVAPDPTVSIRAKVNGKYVSAESAGARPLMASRPAVNTWEKFDLIHYDQGPNNQWVMLKAHANNMIVTNDWVKDRQLTASTYPHGWHIIFWRIGPDLSMVIGGPSQQVDVVNTFAVTAAEGRPLYANHSGPFGVGQEFFITAV